MDCCVPLCCEPLAADDAETMALRMKALADPTRLRLFSMISAGGEQCACDLTDPLGVSQPTVSHHLRILVEAGLLRREQRGKWAFYDVDRTELAAISAFLDPDATIDSAPVAFVGSASGAVPG